MNSRIKNVVCGCPRTKDGSKELQYDCGDVTVHGPEEERRPRKGGDESKYSNGFQERERESMVIGEVFGLE